MLFAVEMFVCCVLLVISSGWYSVYATDEVIVTVHRDVPAEKLSCWTCFHDEKGGNADSNCISMDDKQALNQTVCHLHQSFCRIRKLTNDDTVDLLERSCTNTCTPGCKRIGTRKNCEWCCTQPLCNVGNDAVTVTSHVLAKLHTVAILVATMLLSH